MVHDVAMKVFWAVVMGALNFYRAVFTLLPFPFSKMLAELGYGALFWVGKLAAYVIGLVSTISSLVIQFALSRQREFMADAGAVAITGKPEAMISALRRISGNSTLETSVEGVRAMLFDNAVFGWGGLFATHPPIEQRIAAIARLADVPPVTSKPESPRTQGLPQKAESPNLEQPQPATPTPDAATVERYRALLARAHPEALDVAARQQFYGRARETVQKGKELNLTDAQLAAAEFCVEEAIRQIEAGIAEGSPPADRRTLYSER